MVSREKVRHTFDADKFYKRNFIKKSRDFDCQGGERQHRDASEKFFSSVVTDFYQNRLPPKSKSFAYIFNFVFDFFNIYRLIFAFFVKHFSVDHSHQHI